MIELGLDTFGDVVFDSDGRLVTQAQALRNVVAEAVLADAVGVDTFGVGEHHRPDFSVSAPEVVLGAIAGKTARIVLGSAVTVLSSDDPVRVFQRFSTLDAVSNGRAEVILGRGSFTESTGPFRQTSGPATRHLVRAHAQRLDGTDHLSANRDWPPANVGRRRRQSRFGRTRGAARSSAHARRHRRQREAAGPRAAATTSNGKPALTALSMSARRKRWR